MALNTSGFYGDDVDLAKPLRCITNYEPCVQTRVAALLHSFFYNFWFLGAAYYWCQVRRCAAIVLAHQRTAAHLPTRLSTHPHPLALVSPWCTPSHTSAHTHTHTHTHTHAHAHTHIHAHTHTHIHTRSLTFTHPPSRCVAPAVAWMCRVLCCTDLPDMQESQVDHSIDDQRGPKRF
jgi:hypothetical protein